MLRFNDIAELVESYHPDPDMGLLEKAYVFSAKVHQGQIRLSGEPYLIHPLEVAGILARMRLDVQTVAAGLLHDVLEDTLTTYDELKENFGEEIAQLVDGVTKISRLDFSSAEEAEAENYRKMILAMTRDIRVILIKLADRLHNMRTLQFHREEKQKAISQETLDIYAPIANRLGIEWMKEELEDLAFRYLEPEAYKELSKKVQKGKAKRKKYVEEVKRIILEKLQEHGIKAEVTGRVKQLYSIYQKMQRLGVDFSEIYDIVAFRIIVDTERECYEALGVIHSLWTPVPGKFKDYIALPKANMYQSLHTTVIGPYGERIEIQIRTWEMHKVAEEGIAAHWKYKEGERITDDELKKFAWLRQLLEWQKDLDDSREFLRSLKVDLFPKEVYVFTPKGEVKRLPRGATPVDFAYSIHTEVGHHCAGAKVNGKLVPLHYELKDGDTAEIITSPKRHPSRDWLRFVKTSRARTKILQWLRAEQREKSINLGKELCERDFKKAGLKFSKLLNSGELDRVAEEFSLKGSDDLLAAIGYGEITTQQVIGRLLPQKEQAPAKKESRIGKIIRSMARSSRGLIKIDGAEDIMVRFARCCNPLPGDKVVGFITRGRGITIHTADCINALGADPSRMIEVEWALNKDATLPAKIRVYSADRKGLLAAISSSIADQGVNITGAEVRTTGDGNAISTFDLELSSLKQLNKVINSLRKIKGIMRVERVREWQPASGGP